MAGKGEFEVGQAVDGQWFWRLRADNGEILAHSETYSSKQEAQDGIEAAQKTMRDLDQTGEIYTGG